MNIDVLSQNTLKLTLSRLDMCDLDIRYESLSGKNPDTKRLLSHVLRTVKLDKGSGVDFTGERLFVEAFPRPDGGCMLYISCLEETAKTDNSRTEITKAYGKTGARNSLRNGVHNNVKNAAANSVKNGLLCRFGSIDALGGACKSLSWQTQQGRLNLESALYGGSPDSGEFRLFISGEFSGVHMRLIDSIASEYGQILSSRHDFLFTCEHFNLLVPQQAVEKIKNLF
jgi:hypothetical protein